MAKIIKRVPSEVIEEIFTGIECNKCGCGFTNRHVEQPCGHGCDGTMRPYEKHATRTIPGYVVVKCACRREVQCDAFTNTCDCGREYNWSGQELAPREQWGEETGERF